MLRPFGALDKRRSFGSGRSFGHLRYFNRLIVKESGGERSVGRRRVHLSPALALLRKVAVPVPRFSWPAWQAFEREGEGN